MNSNNRWAFPLFHITLSVVVIVQTCSQFFIRCTNLSKGTSAKFCPGSPVSKRSLQCYF